MTNHTSLQAGKIRDMIAPHAGLALLGDFAARLESLSSVCNYLPKPGSSARYNSSEYTFPLILMLNGGGRDLEDTRQIQYKMMRD